VWHRKRTNGVVKICCVPFQILRPDTVSCRIRREPENYRHQRKTVSNCLFAQTIGGTANCGCGSTPICLQCTHTTSISPLDSGICEAVQRRPLERAQGVPQSNERAGNALARGLHFQFPIARTDRLTAQLKVASTNAVHSKHRSNSDLSFRKQTQCT
jgi:hypothetical protein